MGTRHGLAIALSAVTTAACSPAGPTSDTDSGIEGGSPSAGAFVSATLGLGATSPSCQVMDASPWLAVGTATTDTPSTVSNGQNDAITCQVHASGHGYDVSLSLTESGPAGGRFVLSSPAGQGAVTVSGGTGLTVSITSTVTGATYSQSACALSFTYMNAPIPNSPSVYPGRIWAHVSCPAAQLVGGTDTCDAEADFLFERCAQ